MLVFYVDDILLVSKSINLVASIKTQLASRYKMNDLGREKQFLGLEITARQDYLFLHQQRYILTILGHFGMVGCNDVSTLLEKKCFVPTTPECDKGNQVEYQSILGSLMYLAIGTRPHISYAVSMLSKFSTNPSTIHLAAVKRLL